MGSPARPCPSPAAGLTRTVDDVSSAQATSIRFDPAGVRRDYREAGHALLEVAEAVRDDQWDQVALGEWSVRALVGHAGRAFVTVSDYLRAGDGAPIELHHAFDYAAVFASGAANSAAVAERGRQAGAALGDDPVSALRGQYERALLDLETFDDDAPTATAAGVMRLADYLPTRVFELVVHTDDLCRAVGVPHRASQGARTLALVFAAGVAGHGLGYADALRGLTGRAGLPAGYTVL